MPYKDPAAKRRNHTAYIQKRYAEDPEYRARHLALVQRNKNAKRVEIRAWLLSLKIACLHCGEDHPATLDWHHEDPNTKEVNIATVIRLGWSKKRIEVEISKCIVLCANCHRKLHASLRVEAVHS